MYNFFALQCSSDSHCFFLFFLRNNKRHSPKVFFNYYDFISNPRQLAFCFLRLFFGKTVLLFSILVLGADGIWNLFYCLLMIMVRGLRLYSHVHGCGRQKFSTRQIYRHTHTRMNVLRNSVYSFRFYFLLFTTSRLQSFSEMFVFCYF